MFLIEQINLISSKNCRAKLAHLNLHRSKPKMCSFLYKIKVFSNAYTVMSTSACINFIMPVEHSKCVPDLLVVLKKKLKMFLKFSIDSHIKFPITKNCVPYSFGALITTNILIILRNGHDKIIVRF